MLSPVSYVSIVMWMAQVMSVVYYFVVINLQCNIQDWARGYSLDLLSIVLGPLLVFLYMLFHFVPGDWGVYFLSVSGGNEVRLKGFFSEPNIYGAFISFFIFMSMAKHRTRKIGLLVCMLIGLVLSFSRIPIVAFLIAFVAYFMVLWPKGYDLGGRVFWASIFIFVMIILAGLSWFIFINYGEYDSVGRVHSVTSRMLMLGLAYDSILENWIIGSGVMSFGALHSGAEILVGSYNPNDVWISNLFVAIVHDSGLIGGLFFIAFIMSIFRKRWRVTRKLAIIGDANAKYSAAIFSSGICVIVSSMATPTHLLALFWIVLALMRGDKNG